MEMNSTPWSPVLRYATPLPMNKTPVSTVALQHKSVSSVLRHATPLPINRAPVATVEVLFPPFCGMPDPSRSTGPRSERRRSVSSVVRYAMPRFHRQFRPSPPDEHDHTFLSDPAGWLPRVLLPPDEHDAFRCLPMNTTHSVAVTSLVLVCSRLASHVCIMFKISLNFEMRICETLRIISGNNPD